MSNSWLLTEYDGPRTVEEAFDDLRTIASGGPRSEAHVVVDPIDGEPRGASGFLSLRESSGETELGVEVDGALVVCVGRSKVRRSHLRTFDDADYYRLVLEMDDSTLTVSDAYND